MFLNKQQQEAVDYFDSPLLIIAGPGTGKTRVITEKILKIIDKEDNPDISNKILVSTFTIKSANELKVRLKEDKRIADNVENMQISTIHSFCQKMLETYPEYHEWGSTFSVLDEIEQYIIVKNNYKYKYDLLDIRNELQKKVGFGDIVDNIIKLFNTLSENYVDPEKLIEEIKKDKTRKNHKLDLKIATAYKLYLDDLLDPKNVRLDFALLQREFLKLLESNSDILEKLRDKFYYILIDEYQDTNPIQDKIFRLISEPKFNITTVGDEDQSIYGFRGASISNFRNFDKRYPNAKILKLEKNYRSFKEIVEISDNFISSKRDKPKKIISQRGKFNKPLLIKGEDKFDEAKRVVEFIEDQVKKGNFDYGDVTILFKSVRSHSEPYIEHLDKLEIPKQVIGDGSLLELDYLSKIVRLMSYLNGFEIPTENKREDIRILSLINPLSSEIIGISQESEEKIKVALELGDSLSDFLKKDNIRELELYNEDEEILFNLIEYRNNLISSKKISQLNVYLTLIQKFGFLEKILRDKEKDPYYTLKLKNLALFSELINKYEKTMRKTKFENLFWFLYTLPENKMQDVASIENVNAVKLMTIHQSKGLEFPVVILAGITQNRFGRNGGGDGYLIDIPYNLTLSNLDFDRMEELERIFYVGMTRAEDLLIFGTFENKHNKVSTYITEKIGMDNLQDLEFSSFDKKLESSFKLLGDKLELSYSGVNAYKDCEFRFWLTYVLGFQTPELETQEFGSLVHTALQKLNNSLKEGKNIKKRKIVQIVDSLCKTDESKVNYRDKIIHYLTQYHKNFEGRYNKILEVELPFSYINNDLIIKGYSDLIVENKKGEIEIIDFKSHKESGLEKQHIDLQLRMYNLALNKVIQEKYGKEVRSLKAYTFLDGKEKEYSNSKSCLEETEKMLIDVTKSIEQEQFKQNWGSGFCKTRNDYCAFYEHCKKSNYLCKQ